VKPEMSRLAQLINLFSLSSSGLFFLLPFCF
jgi:hypothetical protein